MENKFGLFFSKATAMASRGESRQRARIGLYPLLLLTLLIAIFAFFYTQNDSPSVMDDSARFAQINTYEPENTVTINAAEDTALIPNLPQAYNKNLLVRSGDTISSLLLAQNIQTQDVLTLLSLPLVKRSLAHINPGQVLSIHVNAEQKLTDLTYNLSATQILSVTRQNDGFDAKLTKKPTKILPTVAAGVISTTFYDAGIAQQLPQKIILDATHLFASKINFKRGLQPGDHFKVIYESSYVENKLVSTGAILAMQISNNGKTYSLVRHTDNHGASRYYTPDGAGLVNTVRNTFLRTPVHYTRISSSFSLDRKHPLLLFSRPHYGVDLSAPRGTPVVASADGVVTVAGKEGGYGNLVIINHGRGVTTRYAHLNHFANNIHPGTYVKQGQVIAYVGSTGLASGPHLHYEYRVNNIAQNPMTVKLPMAVDPISVAEQKQFKREVANYMAQMKSIPLSVLAYAPGLPQNKATQETA